MFSDKKFNLPNKLIEASRLVMEEKELDSLYGLFDAYLEENYHVDQLTEDEIAFIFEEEFLDEESIKGKLSQGILNYVDSLKRGARNVGATSDEAKKLGGTFIGRAKELGRPALPPPSSKAALPSPSKPALPASTPSGGSNLPATQGSRAVGPSTGETLRPRAGQSDASPSADSIKLNATDAPKAGASSAGASSRGASSTGASSKPDFDAIRKSATDVKPVGSGSGIGKKIGAGIAGAAALGLTGSDRAKTTPTGEQPRGERSTPTSGWNPTGVMPDGGPSKAPSSTIKPAPSAPSAPSTAQAKPEGWSAVRQAIPATAREPVAGPKARPEVTQAYANYAQKRDETKRAASGQRPSWADKAFAGN